MPVWLQVNADDSKRIQKVAVSKNCQGSVMEVLLVFTAENCPE